MWYKYHKIIIRINDVTLTFYQKFKRPEVNPIFVFFLKISNQSLNLTYVFICWANSPTFKLFNVYWTLVNKMINQSIVTEHNPGHFLQIGVAVACYVFNVIDKAWDDQTLPFLQLRAFMDLQHKKMIMLNINKKITCQWNDKCRINIINIHKLCIHFKDHIGIIKLTDIT